MSTKTSAIQRIIDNINSIKPHEFLTPQMVLDWCAEAKEIEREQLFDFYAAGHLMGYEFTPSGRETLGAETYYNEQFKPYQYD